MKASDMINELLNVMKMVGDVDIATENGEDFEFDYHNWGSDYSVVELNVKED